MCIRDRYQRRVHGTQSTWAFLAIIYVISFCWTFLLAVHNLWISIIVDELKSFKLLLDQQMKFQKITKNKGLSLDQSDFYELKRMHEQYKIEEESKNDNQDLLMIEEVDKTLKIEEEEDEDDNTSIILNQLSQASEKGPQQKKIQEEQQLQQQQQELLSPNKQKAAQISRQTMAQAIQEFLTVNPKKSQISNKFQQQLEQFERSKDQKNRLYSKIILFAKEIKFLLKEIEQEFDEINNYQLQNEDKLFLRHNTITYLKQLEERLASLSEELQELDK
eukprot:TRINITY_DN4090_c0_g1_i5.p1 TRINITY_DN4090_c0_g1~~TRINITY_DN4090_c0_g1_i5.p1  ORF type:complete len:276 (-),score=74.10 TRINITY_DN4090_c0_g1_i5:77-904(-)